MLCLPRDFVTKFLSTWWLRLAKRLVLPAVFVFSWLCGGCQFFKLAIKLPEFHAYDVGEFLAAD